MPRSYFFIVLRRSLGFWIGLRLLLLVVVLVVVHSFTPALLAVTSFGASLCIVLLTVGVLLFDAKAAGEDLLLANFGFSPTQVGLRALILPTIGEALVLFVLAGR